MKKIYSTNEWSGYGKQNYYHNEYYHDEDTDTVEKHKCHRYKFFDGDENNWEEDDKVVDSWSTDDPDMPDWLNKYI